MTKGEKIKRESQLLKTYKDIDRSKQIDVCKDLIGIWYDTVKYNMEMVHNQEGDPYEYKKLILKIWKCIGGIILYETDMIKIII
jgi:hypothetical protein